MKNKLYIIFTIVLLCITVISCQKFESERRIVSGEKLIDVVVIDSCEYIMIQYQSNTMTHKGNCKFCEERKLKVERLYNEKR